MGIVLGASALLVMSALPLPAIAADQAAGEFQRVIAEPIGFGDADHAHDRAHAQVVTRDGR